MSSFQPAGWEEPKVEFEVSILMRQVMIFFIVIEEGVPTASAKPFLGWVGKDTYATINWCIYYLETQTSCYSKIYPAVSQLFLLLEKQNVLA